MYIKIYKIYIKTYINILYTFLYTFPYNFTLFLPIGCSFTSCMYFSAKEEISFSRLCGQLYSLPPMLLNVQV